MKLRFQSSLIASLASLICWSTLGQLAKGQTIKPLERAHAHNDYVHPRPLLDALDHGFTSIEADVFLVDSDLLVAHWRNQVSPERTLEKLYLEPLHERFQTNGGSIYPDKVNVTLLVDIKQDGAAAYAQLHKQLSKYAEMVSETKDGQFIQRAVTVIVSGDRPIQEITAANPRFAGFDGRLNDLDSDSPASLMPLVSDNWRSHFPFRRGEPFTDQHRARLREIVAKAHAKGRKVRFWATPETEAVWKELREANVDLIGTDHLEQLQDFLMNKASD